MPKSEWPATESCAALPRMSSRRSFVKLLRKPSARNCNWVTALPCLEDSREALYAEEFPYPQIRYGRHYLLSGAVCPADRPGPCRYLPALANSLAFAVSAQLNFLLSSRLTWGDRPAGGWRDTSGRWAAYNGTALLSLIFDTGVFTASYRLVGTPAAAAAGVLAATCLTFLVCNRLIFRVRGGFLSIGPVPATAAVQVPAAAAVQVPVRVRSRR